MDPRFEAKLTVLEKRESLHTAAVAAVLGGIGYFIAASFRSWWDAWGWGLPIALAAGLRLAFGRSPLWPARRERTVRATSDGLEIDGKTLSRHAIDDGLFQPGGGRRLESRSMPTVRLLSRTRRYVFEAEVADELQAMALLRALGLDAGSKRAEFRGASPLGAMATTTVFAWGLVFLVFSASALFLPPLVQLGILPVVLVMLVTVTMPSKLTVGVDGVLVRWLWRKRFVPMSEIVNITTGDRAIRVHRASGEDILIVPARFGHGEDPRMYRDAVHVRLLEAWRAQREHGATRADVALLVGRGSRGLPLWQRALDDLSGAHDYRQAAVREEDLWRVVEDPRAPEDARAGAAVLLRRSLDERGRARVRVAAEATASPELRLVLEAAVRDSDEAVSSALAELAPDDHGGRGLIKRR